MPLKLYPRKNGIFHIRGSVQGVRIDRSAQTRDRREAEQIRAKLEADTFKAIIYGERSVATFADAVIGYIKSGGDPTHMDPLLDAFGTLRLGAVNQAAIEQLAALKPNAKPATLVRQLYTPAAAVLNFAASDAGGKLCDPVRFRKPKVRNARTNYLTPDQAEAWLKALPPHLARIVTFYLATGCRATEAVNLEWRDISPEAERVVLHETKGNYSRSFYLQRRARALLDDRPEADKARVFLNSRGEPWHAYDAINLMLKKTRLEHPKLVPAHCHLFRHTWATWAYAVTRDLTFLMQAGGWRTPSMVMRYAHHGADDLARAVLAKGWEIQGTERTEGKR